MMGIGGALVLVLAVFCISNVHGFELDDLPPNQRNQFLNSFFGQQSAAQFPGQAPSTNPFGFPSQFPGQVSTTNPFGLQTPPGLPSVNDILFCKQVMTTLERASK